MPSLSLSKSFESGTPSPSVSPVPSALSGIPSLSSSKSALSGIPSPSLSSRLYTLIAVALLEFPAASIVVTLASTVVSESAPKSAPGTSILYNPAASTTPVNVFPFTVNVTVSPAIKSPATTPVTGMVVPSSIAFKILSSVISAMVIVGTGNATSIRYTCVSVALLEFPDASVVVTLASTVVSGSAAKSAPGTWILYAPAASTTPVNVLPFTVNVTVSPVIKSPATTPVTGISDPDSTAFKILSSVISAIVIVGTGTILSIL